MKRMLIALLAMVHAAAACGGMDVENQAPIVTGFIEPVTIFVGELHTIAASDVFSDPDGDLLTYSVSNPNLDDLKAELNNDVLTIEGVRGIVAATVTLLATDIHGAQAQLAFEVTVRDALRDDFDSDLGWIGVTGLDHTPDNVEVKDGHLVLKITPEYVLQFALRDIGTIGPNWKVSSRFTTESRLVCYGIMVFTQEFEEGIPPDLIWSIDINPFGDYFSGLYLHELGYWIFLAEGHLPQQQDPDGYIEIAIGFTEENIFYGYAFGDYKLFEFDTDVFQEPPLEMPNTIEHIAVSGTPCEQGGEIWYDWMEVSVQREGL